MTYVNIEREHSAGLSTSQSTTDRCFDSARETLSAIRVCERKGD